MNADDLPRYQHLPLIGRRHWSRAEPPRFDLDPMMVDPALRHVPFVSYVEPATVVSDIFVPAVSAFLVVRT